MSFDEAGFYTEGERCMITKLENYKWAKANALYMYAISIRGRKARVAVMHTNGLTRVKMKGAWIND